MKSIFETPENWKRFYAILNSWEGTPYKHITCVKGRGADCTLFIAGCWKEYGILKDIKYNYYPVDWYIHHKREYVLEYLQEHWENYLNPIYNLKEYSGEEAKNLKLCKGDILSFSTTKQNVTNHASVYLGEWKKQGMMIHCVRLRGVSKIAYNGFYWRNRLTKVFRVIYGKDLSQEGNI